LGGYIQKYTYRIYVKIRVKSLCLIKHYAMKTYKGAEVWLHDFLTSAVNDCGWSYSHPDCFISRERPPPRVTTG
jgi:hypothetical protein